MEGVCDHHEDMVKTLNVMTGQMQETLTALAVIQSTLMDLKATKALNCEARIASLEDDSASFRKLRVGPRVAELEGNSSNCQELRVGPRMEKVEQRQDKLLWGGVILVGANLLGLFFALFKDHLK